MRNIHLDYPLLITSIILIILGILILANTSASLSWQKFGNTFHFLNHQIIAGLIPGTILAIFAFNIPLSVLKKWAPILFLINLSLMVLVFVPKIGVSFRGATRWIAVGPISFQPSEFLKLSFLLYLAAWLSKKEFYIGNVKQKILKLKNSTQPKILRTKFKIKNILNNITINQKLGISQTLLPFLGIIGIISLFLVLQPDISTLGIIVIIGIVMYFLANAPLWHMILLGLTGISALFLLIKIAPYRYNRFLVFLKPDIDPMGISYQIKQSLIAIGSGGIWGKGLGLSVQQFEFLPQTMVDSIFAIFSEETGFLGSLILISLFLIFFWRGFKISIQSQNKFAQLSALGISFWITLQAFINIGAMIGILPLTGVPLPFISYGGSALVTELVGLGILLNISRSS